MRAIIKNVPGVLRVESPPFRSAEYVVNESGDRVLRIRIRFAFDANLAVKDGRPTVTLTMRLNSTRSYRKFDSPKSMNLKNAARALSEMLDSNEKFASTPDFSATLVASKQFRFDLLSAISDADISNFRQDIPANYEYLVSTTSSPSASRIEADLSKYNNREYLLSLVSEGVDPASISENHPVADPLTGQRDTHALTKFNFYTSKIPALSEVTRQYLTTRYVVFEQDIELTREEFLLLTNYEFEYIGTSKKSSSLNLSTVKVKTAEILSYVDSYSEAFELSRKRFERRLDSYFAISPEPFKLISPNLPSLNRRVPAIIRSQSLLRNGAANHRFSSTVTGKVSSSNGRGSKTVRQERDVFPFYLETTGEERRIRIIKLPPGTTRVDVFARDILRNAFVYQKIATNRVNDSQDVSILFDLPKNNRVYELSVSAYDDRGRETKSKNTVTCNNKIPYNGARLIVTPARSEYTEGPTFAIQAEFTDSGRRDLTELLSQLKAAGVSENVVSSLRDESALYSQIFSYRVETISLSTGEQLYTSELTPSSNSPSAAKWTLDRTDPIGIVLNVSLGMKSPDALVPSQPNFRFGKFGGFYRQSQPSSASLAKNKSSGEDFGYIVDTGITVTILVPTKISTGKITNLKATKTFRASTLLKWSYDGDISQVDHFQILGAFGDAECLLGCAFNALSFEDTILSGRVGITRYAVRPIFLDLSVGIKAFVYQTVNTTLPYLLSSNFGPNDTWRISDGFSASQTSISIESESPRIDSQNLGSIVLNSTNSKDKSAPETTSSLSSMERIPTTFTKKSFAATAPSINKSQKLQNRRITRVSK